MAEEVLEKPAVEIRNLRKRFKIYGDRGESLKDRMLSKSRRAFEYKEVLRDISFEVKKGEALALVGKNGCGKSTLLKLMSGILYPDSGQVIMNGRVSSLIELGAGFHPDMTGRENIYTNASIFGLSHKEIARKVDTIIEFSELEEFIDTPVRTYSSGMYMRLAFAVAIHVGADILLIDEILAVGDAAFQAKCFERLMEIKAEGTTICIVSHSMAQLERICDRTIWIDGGQIRMEGAPADVHPKYLEFMGQRMRKPAAKKAEPEKDEAEQKSARIESARLLSQAGEEIENFQTGDAVTLELTYSAQADAQGEEALVGLALYRADKTLCYGTNTDREHLKPLILREKGVIRCAFSPMNLTAGSYFLDVALRKLDMFAFDYVSAAVRFSVYDTIDETGVARLEHTWEFAGGDE